MNHSNESSSPLDPADWEDFRSAAHRLLDECIDHLAAARQRPWRPLTSEDKAALKLAPEADGIGYENLVSELTEKVLPFGSGNTHPRFFAWVHGSGLASGLLSEMVAATINSNCGGRDHGAVYVEREVVRWCVDCFGMPASTSGLLVTGTSQATVLALAIARQKALGVETRGQGIFESPRLTAYAVEGVHNATIKALELLGIGSKALKLIPARADGSGLDVELLAARVAEDRKAGLLPFCVVGTAGSVDLGRFDPLDRLADFCSRENLWFHVDGAFGAWARIAEAPWCDLVRGIDRADSIALDFHKWMYVQYDCGLVLIRDEQDQRAAFASRPAYLVTQEAGLGGGEPWYCDYGTDLSRGFRALKVWSSLRTYGRAAFSAAITQNCRLAAEMGRLVEANSELELMAPVVANVCCFSLSPVSFAGLDVSTMNKTIVQRLQLSGEVAFSTTTLAGRVVIRAAITNHRTLPEDIGLSITAVKRLAAEMKQA